MLKVGDRLGSIRLTAELGAGGMGTVFAGVDETLERPVAVKVVRGDRVTAETRARLLREARVLSRLRHPNICAVYGYVEQPDQDAIVLELVHGRDLAQVVAAGGLERRRRLALALGIARAVAAAHRQGIIHRDLKLANVMLDDEGQVRVLDFGLAALGFDLAAFGGGPPPAGADPAEDLPPGASQVFRTREGHCVGTPAALSPEQARGEPATLASDLYALGLLLQELLTGEPPYGRGLSVEQVLARAETAATRPVTGLAAPLRTLIEALQSADPAVRPTAEQTLARLEAFAARPGRLVRRGLAAAVVLAALLGGVKYTLDLARERRIAVQERARAEAALAEAELARAQSEQVAEFLVGLFAGADPFQSGGAEPTVRQALDRGAERVAVGLRGQPDLRIRLLVTLGRTYNSLAAFARAEALLREALALARATHSEHHEATALALHGLGTVLFSRRDPAAEPLLRRALALREELLGPADARLAETLNSLGGVVGSRGDFAAARKLFERALTIRRRALGATHPDVARTLSNLAYTIKDDPARAEALLREAIAIGERLGPRHPDLATHREALAVVLMDHGRNAEAEPLHRSALAVLQATLGENHPRIALVETNLGNTLVDLGRPAEAERLYRSSLARRERALGADNVSSADTLVQLAELLDRQGRRPEARRHAGRALALCTRTLGPADPQTVRARQLVARLGG